MAGRQAAVMSRGDALEIRDMESPGGTFVNRQRLLAGQARILQPGDLIQLGGVQLRVVHQAAEPTSPQPQPPSRTSATSKPATPTAPTPGRPGALPIPFTIAGAGICRTWDDFLTLAAQRWGLVRDELSSGRLAEHMKRIQRLDLVPRSEPGQSPDLQLDAWLGRLPAMQSSSPELDVHPSSLTLRASAAGGQVRETLRLTNVGYRLLSCSVQIEPPGNTRIRAATGPFLIIDQTDLPIEIDLTEDSGRSRSDTCLGAVRITSNGGTKRIEVRLERASRVQLVPAASPTASALDLNAWARPLGARLAALPLAVRFALAPLTLMVLRLLISFSTLIPPWPAGAGRTGELRLDAIALLLGSAGLLAGALWAARRGNGQEGSRGLDMASAGFAGGLIGLFTSAVGFALIRSVESVLGSWSNSTPAATALWGVLGLALAILSWLFLPPQVTSSGAQAEPIT
jgi:hypothetical protein